ncbi:MAG: hypothetical protein JXR46_16895 [Calditrichaceae bacterium]|nr:hypothetical protein [Calditrichaceae bacterium]MBN2710726.1 hypothetical protein [Calditrichaceae bacterium]RQV92755.1 MAG: hypothetical protein EH224_14580 [Calditrichota bacterium]
MKLKIKKIFTFHLASAFLWLQIFSLFPALYAQDDEACAQKLALAEEQYYAGDFDAAIETAKECLKTKDLSEDLKIQVFSLLAKSFMAKDDMDTAKKLILRILEFKPDYHPTIEQETPRYVSLVEEARDMKPESAPVVEKQSGTSKKWWWIGGGAVAVTAVMAVILSGGGDDEKKGEQPLPGPPDYPDN